MTKIFNDNNIIQSLKKYNSKFDVEAPGAKKFISETAGAILMLVPEISEYINKNWNINEEECAFMAIAALGDLLRKVGEANLDKIKELNEGEDNEDTTINTMGNNALKLCQ